MSPENTDQAHHDKAPCSIVITGIVALAIAMGIGRFAFTPLMPLMLRDGTIDATTGTEWAAANYGGYLLGALTASWFSGDSRRGLRLGLTGIALTTLGIAWIGSRFSLGGALLRAAAGIFSAWVLVCASSWCLAELARRHSARLGGWIYTGVGLGIALTGVMTWLGGQQSAKVLWIELGALAASGAAFAMYGIRGQLSGTTPVSAGILSSKSSGAGQRNAALVFCYGSFGFGYIIPATFLPTMARQLVSDPLVFGLTWPIFGLAAALSVAAVSCWISAWPRRKVWAIAQGTMALGTLLPLFCQTIWALALSAMFVGGTFMVATMAGLQLARERMPANPTPLLARMTAGFAVGQIAGPVLVRAIGPGQIAGWDALSWANAAATVLLTGTAIWLWRDSAVTPATASNQN
ncbi:MAG TPA: YbfB/YjiJ family MFS transporter [Noviherbaspirillum sp.]